VDTPPPPEKVNVTGAPGFTYLKSNSVPDAWLPERDRLPVVMFDPNSIVNGAAVDGIIAESGVALFHVTPFPPLAASNQLLVDVSHVYVPFVVALPPPASGRK
jgi:hypothetical protein